MTESAHTLDAAAVGITRCSRELRYLSANAAYAQIIGLPVEKIVGRPIADVIGAEAFDAIRPHIERVLKGEKEEYEREVPFAGSGKRFIHVTYAPCFDDSGCVTGWVATVVDISARRQAEATIEGLNRQLSAELKSLMRLHELSTQMAAVSEYRRLLDEILNAAIEVTAADMGNIQLLEDGSLKIITHRGFDAPFLDFFASVEVGDGCACEAAMRTRERIIVEDVANSPIFADPQTLDVMLAAHARAVQSTPLVSRSGRLIGMFSTHFRSPHQPSERDLRLLDLLARLAADLIEKQLAEETLRRQSALLKEADRRKDEFLATLAHELRNPLAPLRNAIELLRRANESKPLMEQALGVADRQLSQMARLVDDLLDNSRIATGKLQLRMEPVELVTVLNTAIEIARPVIEASAHELSVTLPPHAVHVQADPVRLAQAFSNLLNNAAKYSDKSGHIRLTAERCGDKAVISVRDSGIGIAPEHLARIFTMFSQMTPALDRSQGGLGVGLSLVKALIELHGGTIEALSDGPGTGSKFTVHLPVIDAPVQAPSIPTSNSNGARRVGKCRVLVVDDLRDAANSMAIMLRMMGHETATAYDGLEAVETAAAFRPDVMLIDIGLPKMNGYETARHIRGAPWGSNVALVALTGWGQEQDKQRALDAGFDQHLTKPVPPSALKELLANLAPVLERS
jgi:PAS domain S-box-containing protein